MQAVRYVGRGITCNEAYREYLNSNDTAIVDSISPQRNVTIAFSRDGRPLSVPLRPHIRDLFHLAAATYILDELVSRSDSEDGWTRDIELYYPVSDPQLWGTMEQTLGSMLRTLTGDRFSFTWDIYPALPRNPLHRTALPRGFDAVCLFSGGLDSFIGAYRLLADGLKVILAGHDADGKTAPAQTEMASYLMNMFPGQVTLVQCWVARSRVRKPRYVLPEKAENSHRIRSFLFLSIAVAVSTATGTPTIVIPENGLISLNSPLQRSRLGTLSTRTAYPLFLSQFQDLVTGLDAFRGRIFNPYLYMSKTDMVNEIDDAIRPYAWRTLSCAHIENLRWQGRNQARQCGYCVACIYRRLAMLGAGLDVERDYIDDVFRDLSSLSATKQADMRAIVQFACKVTRSSVLERQMMVVSHGMFPPEIGEAIGPHASSDYSPWADMLLRWAEDCLAKVREIGSAETIEMLRPYLG